ncbi:MAG: type II secretion system F family protein [Candidatus Marinimicrobia bacterium]|jgi:type IV pilus assembly protein PilC|nr:type II secretion system F family protein [Candidatus Neomarinimicrobiota bacterium]MBT3632440.1 type II secretion system F family protein [Candidatus Neomarinimicrobiota bacterium]MBT3825280.1 type II secretion system F family protein [Candidatus Neomarinimicrobiota bacterium]MBT4130713.1 type II secretion system F family protein [Candidatus Neomarinimicrobiota bacterium]MBT4295437.1 type II secretion system F family protein [Candidatus Neomarinimicrobiota bacterium]
MGNFRYIAVDLKGKRTEGTLGGFTREEVSAELRRMGLKPVSVEPVRKKKREWKLSEINLSPPKVDPALKVVFFRELSTLLDAGIQLVDAISIIQLQFEDKNFQKAIGEILVFVKSGHPFSDALSEHKHIFPPFVISLVTAAEMGGGLDKILSQIAVYIEKEDDVRKRLSSATSYPKFIGMFFGVVLIGVMFGLMPKFADIFASFGAELPASTQIMINISDFLRNNLILEAILGAASWIGFKAFKASPKGKYFLDKHIFKMPVAGHIIHKSMVSRFAKTLSVLIRAEVSIVNALKIAGNTSDNEYIKEITEHVALQVTHGRSMGGQLAKYTDVFPIMVSSMITVGEKSGALAIMLEKISEFHEADFNTAVDKLSKTIEPIIMGGLGVVISIIIVTLYLPIFQMSSAIH